MNVEIQPEKSFIFDYVDRNADALARLGDSIFYFAELGMQEHETAALMTGILADAGFEIERGLSGFPTAFMASWGSGAPVIAINTEYDANPDNSQAPGVAEQREIEPGAPGHCEGHNVNAAVMVTAGLALRHTMERSGIGGTLRLFGAPAEEQLLSRPFFVRDGYFDDVDIAFHDHIWHEFKSDYGLLQSAGMSVQFTFLGESAHAAMEPWNARDALDAVVLMDVGVAQYREHMRPTMKAHRAITHGGTQPNVIPSRATVWWYFRDSDADGARALFEQAERIARGAALMTNCEVEVDVMSAVWPVRGNRTVAETIQRNIELVGMPEWTAEEHSLAAELQRKAGAAVDGLREDITPLLGPARQIAASNDCGDISWAVPMARVWFPSNIPNIGFHHWAAGVALATSIAHKGGVAGAKALAGAAFDFFRDETLRDEARASFAEEIGDARYKPLLPAGKTPPVDLNRALMEAHRPAMRRHYLKEKPVFS